MQDYLDFSLSPAALPPRPSCSLDFTCHNKTAVLGPWETRLGEPARDPRPERLPESCLEKHACAHACVRGRGECARQVSGKFPDHVFLLARECRLKSRALNSAPMPPGTPYFRGLWLQAQRATKGQWENILPEESPVHVWEWGLCGPGFRARQGLTGPGRQCNEVPPRAA